MKRRFLLMGLYAIPGLLAATAAAMVSTATVWGALWLLVYGDDSWPADAGRQVMLFAAVMFAVVFFAVMVASYLLGKRLEGTRGSMRAHLWTSVSITLLFAGVVIAHQYRVGNLGTPSDSVLCSRHCQSLGHAASGLPPRESGDQTCSCYDAQGKVAATVQLGRLKP